MPHCICVIFLNVMTVPDVCAQTCMPAIIDGRQTVLNIGNGDGVIGLAVGWQNACMISQQWSGKTDGLFIIIQWISPHGRSKFPTIGWQSDCNFNPPAISRWTRKYPGSVADSSWISARRSIQILANTREMVTDILRVMSMGI